MTRAVAVVDDRGSEARRVASSEKTFSGGRARPGSGGYMRQPRLAELVAAQLREQIVDGELPDGAALPNLDGLVEQFGVSPPSVREALRILENEQLLTVRRGNVGGAVVHAPKATGAGYMLGLVLQSRDVKISDVTSALTHLQALCAGLCAQRPDREKTVVPKLRKAHQAVVDALESEAAEFERYSRTFHEEIVNLCGNETLHLLVRTLLGLWAGQEMAWSRRVETESPGPELRREGVEDHEQLLEAIERGDSAQAAKIMTAHTQHPEVYGAAQKRKDRIRTTDLTFGSPDGRAGDFLPDF